jgi:membrane protein DedA with SNARE-associated domain
VSPLKKANNKAPTKSAQRRTKKSSVRTSRVASQEVEGHSGPAESQREIQGKPRRSKFQINALRILALLAVMGLTVFIYILRDRVSDFAAFGYPGIFIVALLANATVLLPAPGVAIIYAMGAIFNPFGVGLAAGTGGAIGELTGYLAGISGQAVIERTDVYDRIKPWVKKYGGWAIMVLSAIPNPFFDVAGIAAGMAKMPVQTFLVFTWIGQLIKMTFFALAGKYSIQLFTNFIR